MRLIFVDDISSFPGAPCFSKPIIFFFSISFVGSKNNEKNQVFRKKSSVWKIAVRYFRCQCWADINKVVVESICNSFRICYLLIIMYELFMNLWTFFCLLPVWWCPTPSGYYSYVNEFRIDNNYFFLSSESKKVCFYNICILKYYKMWDVSMKSCIMYFYSFSPSVSQGSDFYIAFELESVVLLHHR